MLLNDAEIRKLCVRPDGTPMPNAMIEPFSEAVQGGGVVSFGLTHCGYDVRLGNTLLVFKNTANAVVDPKRFKDEAYRRKVFDEVVADWSEPESRPWCPWMPKGAFMVPPHSYVLGYLLEYLRIPRNLKARFLGKSTYARCGLVVNTTPAEPGWEGHLTLEIANTSPCPVLIYAGEGIAQMEVETLIASPETDYAEKGGKYQNQAATPVPARMKE